jgi:branched-chain amino acid aminotransferase
MLALANTRVVWFNGEFVPESEALIPFRDRSWKHGAPRRARRVDAG